MKVVLREAFDKDAPAVAEVLIASRQRFIPYAPMAHSPSEVVTWVRSLLIPSRGVTVAFAPEAVVGVVATSQAEGVAWIDQLYVLPGFVGKGVGSLLLRHGLANLPRPVRLYTFQANVGAQRFFERHGFRAMALSDGSTNEEKCPDVLFELAAGGENAA
jgi:ribosomal protein S18 acetylase RimI-like enzyme